MSDSSWLLDSPLVYRLGSGLVHFVWQGAIVAVASGVVLWLLRLRSAGTRYVALWSALVAMAACVPVTVWLSDLPAPAPDSAADVRATVAIVQGGRPLAGQHSGKPTSRGEQDVPIPGAHATDVAVRNVAELEGPATTAKTLAAGEVELANSPSESHRMWWFGALPWIVGGWLVGAVGLSLWRVGGWLHLRRICRVGTRGASHETIQMFERLLERLRVSRPVRLLESTLARSPIVIGWLRPAVLLPVSIVAELPPQQLEMILAHELAHIRRWDFLWNLVQTAIETLLFFHPAVWWVSRQIRVERETCCDDMAAGIMGDRLLYARSLASLEEMRHGQKRRPDSSLQVAADNEALLSRIRRVLGLPNADCRAGYGWLGGLLGVSLVVAALAGYMAIAGEPTKPSEETNHGETEERTTVSTTQLPAGAARTMQAYQRSVAEADGEMLRDLLCFVDERDKELFLAFSPKDGEHFARLGIFRSGKVLESKKASQDCWLVVLENNRLLELWQMGGEWRVLCPMPGHLRMAQGKLAREEGLRYLQTQEMQRVEEEDEAQLQRRRARYLALLDLKSRYPIGNLFMYYSGIPADNAAELSAMSVADFRKAVMLKLDAPSGLRYRVEPDSNVYEEGQPVVVTFVLENVTDRPLTVPYRPAVEIVDSSNTITARGALVFPKGTDIEKTDRNRSPYRGQRIHPFERRVVLIQPGEAVSSEVNLRDYYDLPPARYTVSAHLMVEGDEQRSLWSGQARTDTVGFAVQAPSEQEASGGKSEIEETRRALVQKFAGVVTGEQGKPLEGVTVKMCGVERFHDGRWHRNCRPDCMVPRPTTSDKTGRFSVEFTEACFEMPIDERKTRFNLWLSKAGYAPTYLPGISPKPQETKVILQRGIRVSGTVKRQTNGQLTPIQGAVVYLQCSSGDRAHQERVFDEPYFFLLKRKEGEEGCDLPYQQRVLTDADGRCTITLSSPPKDKRWFLVCSDESWHKDSSWRGPKLVKAVFLDVREGQPTTGADFVVSDESNRVAGEWSPLAVDQLAEDVKIRGGNITFEFESPMFLNITAVQKRNAEAPIRTFFDQWSDEPSTKYDLCLKTWKADQPGGGFVYGDNRVYRKVSINYLRYDRQVDEVLPEFDSIKILRSATTHDTGAGYELNAWIPSDTGEHRENAAWETPRMRLGIGEDVTLYKMSDPRAPDDVFSELTIRFSRSLPAAGNGAETIGGLRGRLVVAKPVIGSTHQFRVDLRLQNVSETPISITHGNPADFEARVNDSHGKVVEPTSGRVDVMHAPKTSEIQPKAELTIPVTIKSIDGAKGSHLDTTTRIWTLPAGKYSLGGTYKLPAGQLALPPVELEIRQDEHVGEVDASIDVRLRAEKAEWRHDETPIVTADLRNRRTDPEGRYGGSRGLVHHELEVDGKWCNYTIVGKKPASIVVPPGKELKDALIFPLLPDWARQVSDNPQDRSLRLRPGRHTVRVAVNLYRGGKEAKRPDGLVEHARFVSNRIEIEILAPEPGESAEANLRSRIVEGVAWGEPKGGLRLGLAPEAVNLAPSDRHFTVQVWFENCGDTPLEVPQDSSGIMLAAAVRWKNSRPYDKFFYFADPTSFKHRELKSGEHFKSLARQNIRPRQLKPGERIQLECIVGLDGQVSALREGQFNVVSFGDDPPEKPFRLCAGLLFDDLKERHGGPEELPRAKDPNPMGQHWHDPRLVKTNEIQVHRTDAEADVGDRAAEGVVCRLRVDKTVWEVGKPLKFHAEIRSTGPNKWMRPTGPRTRFQMEMNGRWYSWVGQVARGPGDDPNPQAPVGNQPETIPIEVDWAWRDDSGQWLKCLPGKYTVRVAIPVQPAGDADAESTRMISNPVQIEIATQDDPAPQIPWGPASEGVQARLRADRRTWKHGETPTVLSDVRNRGARELHLWRHQALCELEFDGRWYEWTRAEGSFKSSWFPKGREYFDIPFKLLDNWQSKAGKEPLALTAGQHKARVAIVARSPNAKDRNKLPPIRSVSNEVTIEILPPPK